MPRNCGATFDLAEREGLPASAAAELGDPQKEGLQQKNRSAALRASFFIPVRFCSSEARQRFRK
jgi:hypothetical protein